jgi:hypothetical protein
MALIGYATGLIDNLNLDVEHIVKRLDFVRFSHVVEAEQDAKSCIQETVRRIKIGGDKISEFERKNEWNATPGYFCDWCGFAIRCPYSTDIIRVRTMSQAIKVAGEVLALEARKDAQMKLLRSFCKIAGPVIVNGVRFGYKDKEDFNFIVPKLLEWAEKTGKPKEEVVNAKSTKQLKEYYRKDLEIDGALVVGKKTEWAHTKIKD